MKALNIISAAFLLSLTTTSFAESTTGSASVVIQDTITFAEDQVVDFGAISDSDGTCTMAATGALSGQCAGQPNGIPGQFTVSGTAGQAVSISVGSGTTVGGVTFNPVLASSSSATLDVSGNSTVDVIGSLDLLNATGGAKSLTYTLTVNYN